MSGAEVGLLGGGGTLTSTLIQAHPECVVAILLLEATLRQRYGQSIAQVWLKGKDQVPVILMNRSVVDPFVAAWVLSLPAHVISPTREEWA